MSFPNGIKQMPTMKWTRSQHRRLLELNAAPEEIKQDFPDSNRRNQAFSALVKRLTKKGRQRLDHLRRRRRRPALCRLESALVDSLTRMGLVQVTTPVIMSKGLLARMNITPEHPLHAQVYWIESDKCLRPMLAPHLYYVMKDLLRLWEKPVGIFEVGPCFRKESQGARHSIEFTMLNLCEFGLPEPEREARLKAFARVVMETAGIDTYHFETESSAVYGTTIDVVSPNHGGLELGSGAMGPHPLDHAWRVIEPWVGIGFGLERLLMAVDAGDNLSRLGRSISYLDGVRLNIP